MNKLRDIYTAVIIIMCVLFCAAFAIILNLDIKSYTFGTLFGVSSAMIILFFDR